MKTAVSIPDDVFRQADRLARRLELSRSAMYAAAVREFVARHDRSRITERINDALEAAGENGDPGAVAFGIAALRRTEWRPQEPSSGGAAPQRPARVGRSVQRARGRRASDAG